MLGWRHSVRWGWEVSVPAFSVEGGVRAECDTGLVHHSSVVEAVVSDGQATQDGEVERSEVVL